MLLKLIRKVLGAIVLTLDWIFTPKARRIRTEEERKRLAPTLATLKLYQFVGCPFCVKVRRELKRLDLEIELRDVKSRPEWEAELIKEGGMLQVPCLRIESAGKTPQWLYESDAIIDYLSQRFGSSPA